MFTVWEQGNDADGFAVNMDDSKTGLGQDTICRAIGTYSTILLYSRRLFGLSCFGFFLVLIGTIF
jgi:hypothetical protein